MKGELGEGSVVHRAPQRPSACLTIDPRGRSRFPALPSPLVCGDCAVWLGAKRRDGERRADEKSKVLRAIGSLRRRVGDRVGGIVFGDKGGLLCVHAAGKGVEVFRCVWRKEWRY